MSVDAHRADSRRPGPLDSADRPRLLVIAMAAVAVFVAGFLAPPDGLDLVSDDATGIRRWVEGNAAALHVAAVSITVAALGLVVVASGVSALVRRHLPGSMLPELMLAGSLGAALVLLADLTAQTTGLLLPGLVGTRLTDVDDAVLVGWTAVGGVTHLLADLQVAFLAVAITAGSLAALRLQLVNRWLCYAGIAVGASAVLGTASILLGATVLYPFWFVTVFGLFASMLVLAVSALLTRRRVGRAVVSIVDAAPVLQSRES
jgi:hypothetical protein